MQIEGNFLKSNVILKNFDPAFPFLYTLFYLTSIKRPNLFILQTGGSEGGAYAEALQP